MSQRVPLTADQLNDHLREQIEFLIASAASFDNGYESEAKRLAVTLRVLLHDTKNSKSLLGQLNKLGKFFDTAFSFRSDSLTPHSGLISINYSPAGTRYAAGLDNVPNFTWVPFVEWWNAIVFSDRNKQPLSRKGIILTASDQDGGAHVDPSLDTIYHDLTRNNSLGWVVSDATGSKPMPGPEKAAIRQITHEVLKTLIPEYSKWPVTREHEVSIMGVSITPGFKEGALPSHLSASPTSRVRQVKIGRNQTCPCNSGLKFKRCCGKA